MSERITLIGGPLHGKEVPEALHQGRPQLSFPAKDHWGSDRYSMKILKFQIMPVEPASYRRFYVHESIPDNEAAAIAGEWIYSEPAGANLINNDESPAEAGLS